MREGLSTAVRDLPRTEEYTGDAMHDVTGATMQETPDGLWITIPAGATKTIEMTSHYAGNHHTKLLISIEAGAQTIITRRITGMGHGMIKEDITLLAGQKAQVTYNEVQQLPKNKDWESTKIGQASEDASINWYTHVKGGHTNYHRVKNTLQAGARAIILGTTDITGDQQSKATMQTIHKGPRTTSGMYAKTIVAENARTLHKGLVRIEQLASDASGYQQEDALIIGQDAQANAMPELEIENPNVTCSHGSTIGHVDEQQLFYLRSRGLTAEEAMALLTTSFLRSITVHAPAAWAEQINQLLEERT